MKSTQSSPEVTSTETQPQPRFSYKDATHEEVLEDLSSRFILNLPDEELASLERICFQVEQAHWFYEDFIREQNSSFPSLHLKKFSAMLFHACPLLHQWSHDHENAFNQFMQYKTRVPVCGAIMLNSTWDKCVLVKGWKSSSGWGFPKGKINESEPPHICAIREVLEETGYNLAGKVKPEDVIELSIKEQKISLFIVPDIEEDFPFQTKTRKEISRIEWFRLIDLPTWKRNKQVPGKFYLISPFIGPLKAFINEHKPRSGRRVGRQKKNAQNQSQAAYASDVNATDGDTDLIQESDSQMSINQHNDATSEQESTAIQDQRTESFDPQLARLLTSLAISASTSIGKPSHDTQNPPTESATPLPNQNRKLDPELPAPSPQHFTKPSEVETLHSFRDASSTPVVASTTTSRTNANYLHRNTTQETSCSPTHTQKPDSSPVITRSPTMRRSTITADVSPYLMAKNTEIPGSARRLQQLALLESVASESARMTPHPSVNQRPAVALPVHPGPPASVPPPAPLDGPLPHIYYSSQSQNAPGGHAYVHGLPGASNALNSVRQTDIHPQSRAKTSQAFHRGPHLPPGSMSMNQGQLLALMNTQLPTMQPQPALSANGNFHQQPQPYAYPYPPFIAHTNGPNPLQHRPMVGNNLPGNPSTFSLDSRYASATPAVDMFPSRAAHNNTAQTLLSILNGGRPMQNMAAPPNHPL